MCREDEGAGVGGTSPQKLPRSKTCHLPLNDLCVIVKVALLGPFFGTAGN